MENNRNLEELYLANILKNNKNLGESDLVNIHKSLGYKDARAFTKEEKLKLGLDPEAIAGTLGYFGIDSLPPFMKNYD